MPLTKSHLASLAVASVALVGGGVAAANAAGGAESTTPSSSASAPATAGQQPGSPDTPVTGAAKTKVVDAVEQAHDGVSITDVRQDPDGSYDALGTDADGNPVFYDVSKDLATITEHTGPGGAPAPGSADASS